MMILLFRDMLKLEEKNEKQANMFLIFDALRGCLEIISQNGAHKITIDKFAQATDPTTYM